MGRVGIIAGRIGAPGRIGASPLANTRDLTITRLTKSGSGSATSRAVQAEGLTAYFEPKEAEIVDPDTKRIRVVTGTFWIDPVDTDLATLDVVTGDVLSYTDWRGKAIVDREIIAVDPFYDGTLIHHVVLSVG